MRATLAVVMFLATFTAQADLGSGTYLQAKEMYSAKNYSQTIELLEQYKSEDNLYLASNKDIEDRINAVIDYCRRALGPSAMIVAGSKVIFPPPPTLP